MNVEDPFDPRYLATEFVADDDPAQHWVSFMIITSDNPRGKLCKPDENAERQIEFECALKSSKYPFLSVLGVSPCNRHSERSFAIPCDRIVARELCEAWHQLAFYAIEQGTVYLVETRSGAFTYVDHWSNRLRIG